MESDRGEREESEQRYRCGSTDTASGDPCRETVAGPEQRCYRHDPDHPGEAGPPGNANAVGNDGGAPAGNTNAMRTGEYMDLKRKRDALAENFGDWAAKLFFEKLQEYREICDRDSRANELATIATFKQVMLGKFAEDAFETTKYSDDGTPFEAFDSDLWDAAMKGENRVRIGLAYEGVRTKPSKSSQGHDNLNKLVSDD